jgi:hypothetical protein
MKSSSKGMDLNSALQRVRFGYVIEERRKFSEGTNAEQSAALVVIAIEQLPKSAGAQAQRGPRPIQI